MHLQGVRFWAWNQKYNKEENRQDNYSHEAYSLTRKNYLITSKQVHITRLGACCGKQECGGQGLVLIFIYRVFSKAFITK